MSAKAKTAIIFIILSIIAFSLAGGGIFLYQKEHSRNLALQDEMDEIKTRLKVTESKLEEAKGTFAALEIRLKDTRTQMDALNNVMEEEKAAKEQALTQIEQLRVDLEEQKQLRAGLENKFSVAQSEVRTAQAQLMQIQSEKLDLETKIEDLQSKSNDLATKLEGVELGKIVVTPEKSGKVKKEKVKAEAAKKKVAAKEKTSAREVSEETPSAATLDGKVLVVNKEYNFAVINVGSKDDVKLGDTFSVFHGNKFVGDIKISKVHESMAAGDFLNEKMKDAVAEGDKVVQKS